MANEDKPKIRGELIIMGRLTEIVNNVATNGSVFKVTQAEVGSVFITNASIDVDVNVNDYVSVQASGAWIAVSGETTVTQGTDPWVVVGSQAITNMPYVIQSGDFLVVDSYPKAGGTTKHEGIHIAASGIASATNFSGVLLANFA